MEKPSFWRRKKPPAFRLYLPSSDTNAFEGRLAIAFGSFSETVEVSALAPPAHFIIDPAGQPNGGLDFGQVEAGKVALQSFQLRNIGGSAGEVRFLTDPPYSVMAASGRATLAPQQAESFAVRLSAPESYSGVFTSEVKIEGDNGQTLKLPLSAAVAPVGSPITQGMPIFPPLWERVHKIFPIPFRSAPDRDRDPDSPPDPSQSQAMERLALEELEAMRSPLGFVTVPTVERDISENIPPVDAKSLKLEEEGHQHLSVSWPLYRR